MLSIFLHLKRKNIRLFYLLLNLIRSLAPKFFRIYPFCLGSEIKTVSRTLKSGDWNSAYSDSNSVTSAESYLSKYFDCKHAILVSSGGVGLEMVLRLLLKPNDFVAHHTNTCLAVPFSILRSCRVPLPFNSSSNPFYNNFFSPTHISFQSLLLTHFWGCIDSSDYSSSSDKIIDDLCLSFGSSFDTGLKYNPISLASIFSFGCIKPIQAGEGGLILTNDDEFALSLRSMLNYGNSIRYISDPNWSIFGLNGRISNVTASIIEQQLQYYDRYLNHLRSSLYTFSTLLQKSSLPFEIYNLEHSDLSQQSLTAIIISTQFLSSDQLVNKFRDHGVNAFPAFFPSISSDNYFKQRRYRSDFPFLSTSELDHAISLCFSSTPNFPYVCIPRFWIDSLFFRRKLLSIFHHIALDL
jgi:dTDP-4-amino-4,6-dideoxygalactose transaminase